MSAPLCGWSEDRLAVKHPRYAKIFRRQLPHHSEGAGYEKADGLSEEEEDDGGGGGGRPRVRTMAPGHPRRLTSPAPPLPAPPQPSADKALLTVDVEEATKEVAHGSSTVTKQGDVDIWAMKPVEAVNLLCAYVELLLREARQKPPKPLSPPVSSSSSSGTSSRNGTPSQNPSSSTFRNPSEGNVDPTKWSRKDRTNLDSKPRPSLPELAVSPASSSPEHPHLQRVPRASRTPIDSPVSNPRTPIHSVPPSPRLPHIVVTESDRKVQSHHLAKRFFCKSVPNVSLAAYLGRIHKYCHMSTAVYLAAGMYIERLSQEDWQRPDFPTPRSSSSRREWRGDYDDDDNGDDDYGGDDDQPLVELTPRSVHRLLLAALRVANKALSDLYWPHKRVADVGGVSQLELQRLEVSMCYLCDFKLQVSLGDLEKWVRRMRAMGLVDAGSPE